MARQRLTERIAAGTAEVVLGDAMTLPWEDGRFSVVSSLNCLKFVPDPPKALRETHRVLRSGGRVVMTCDEMSKHFATSGEIDAMGQWQWSTDAMRQLMEEAGFREVSVERMPTRLGLLYLRGAKPASAPVAEVAEAPALAGEASR